MKLKKLFVLLPLLLLLSCGEEISPSAKGSGGVIDGGGTDIDYAKIPYIEEQLDKVILLLTNEQEEMNLLRRFIDNYPVDYDENRRVRYTNARKFIETIYFRDSSETIIQKLIGNSAFVQQNLYYLCKVKRKKVTGLYLENTKLSNYGDEKYDCIDERLDNSIRLSNILKRERFDFKNRCYDLNGEEKVASVSSFDLKARICLSKSQLTSLPKADIFKNLTAIVIHELAHLHGESEEAAKKLELFVIKNFYLYYSEIATRQAFIANQREDYLIALDEIAPYLPRLLPTDPDRLDFNSLHYELKKISFDLSQYLISQTLSFTSIYPKHIREEYDKTFSAIENIIKKNFYVNKKDSLRPRSEIFPPKEISIISGENDNYEEWYVNWKIVRTKYLEFFKEINIELAELYSTLEIFDNTLPTTQRIEMMQVIDEELLSKDSYDDQFSGF